MKITIRIAALVLIVLWGLVSNASTEIRPKCDFSCPDVYNPCRDASGRTFGNCCYCRCGSTQPDTCSSF